jgi:hypothetical protein
MHANAISNDRRRLRREFLQIAGAALGTLAMPSWPQVVAAWPSPAGQAEGRIAFSLRGLGPRLIAAGVIDPTRFLEACARAGAPLTPRGRKTLTEGGVGTVELDGSNAHFLLNFFWAVGLANANALLTRGPMMRNGMGRIPGYASTGGWSLGARPAMDVYAHLPLISLTPDQQRRLEEVSSNVYRPCCDNPTSFPDCNHGMAMVGLLTLLAAEDRDVEALFGAAKAVNGAWFTGQTLQLATYSRAALSVEYPRLNPRVASGRGLFSGSGFRNVTSWLQQHGLAAPPERARC